MHSRENGYRHIWLLSGTGEGPSLARSLVGQGWKVSVSVVSSQASLAYEDINLSEMLVGPLGGVEEILKFLKKAQLLHHGFDWVIDATHPFAQVISSDLQIACQQVSQPILRFERPLRALGLASLISNARELEDRPLKGKNVLLAMGSRHLSEYVASVNQAGANVFARVLPSPESLSNALACSVREERLAVLRPLQGDCIGQMEASLCKRWSIDVVVCRQSGGLNQQTWEEICKDQKLGLFLVSRPPIILKTECFDNLNSLLNRISSPIMVKHDFYS